MELPYRFPDPSDEAFFRAQEFRSLSTTQRCAEIAAMMAFGWHTVVSSPRRQWIEQRMDEQEAASQRIQAELFARHGR